MSSPKENLEIVYMLKSAYYPDFRRRILSLLSIPNGIYFETDYDEKWISEKIKNDPNHFKGKRAYAIFLDFSVPELNFYPLRECKIMNITRDGVLFKFTLELGNYKIPSDQEKFSNTVRNFMLQNNIYDPKQRKLVFNGDDKIEKELSENTKQDNAWNQIVDHLTSLNDIEVPPNSGNIKEQFKKSLFYQIRITGKEDFNPVQMNSGGFKFKTGNEYLLRFYVYQPHFKNFSSNEIAELKIASETKYIRYVGEGKIRMPLGQRVYTKDFEFWTSNVMMGGKSKILLERADDEFNAPYISLYFSLPLSIKKIAIIFGVLILGLFMIGESDYIAELTNLPKLIWSFIGAALSSSILAFFEYLRIK